MSDEQRDDDQINGGGSPDPSDGQDAPPPPDDATGPTEPTEPTAGHPEGASAEPSPDAKAEPEAEPEAEAEASPEHAEAGAPEPRAGADPEISDEASAALKAAQQAVAQAMGGGLDDSAELTDDDQAAAESAQASARDTFSEAQSAAGRTIGASLPVDGDPSPMSLPAFEKVSPAALAEEMRLLGDVNVDVRIELGRTRMLVEDVLRLSEGAVVELEKLAGDPVDIFVNGRRVAKGEVLVLNENFCVRVNEVVEPLPVSESS